MMGVATPAYYYLLNKQFSAHAPRLTMAVPVSVVPLLLLVALCLGGARGLLYPRESESREVKVLDGVWYFRADFSSGRDAGFTEKWYSKPLVMTGETSQMPVPSSWNDVTQNVSIKEYIGWVWYDREAWVPTGWKGMTVMLRFESAHYNAIAWVNGVEVVSHSGGHLPFEANITGLVQHGAPNRVTVAINNTLTPHTLPPGTLTLGGPPELPEGYMALNYQFDFYNYAGLHRPVKLYTTPLSVHVDDVTVVASLLGNGSAVVAYEVAVFASGPGSLQLQLALRERHGSTVASASLQLPGCSVPGGCVVTGQGQLLVEKPRLWWPWTMSPDDPGYLYTLEVIATTSEKVSDYYRLPVGIRTVAIENNKFTVNGKPFYFHGVDKHEDADIRGKGLDYPLMLKDMNLFKWLGVNAFRTSHYPYAEEFLDLAAEYGIAIIDESPAVGLHEKNFVNETLQHHLEVMQELVQRDKNRPAVIMWSLANEPQTNYPVSGPYFKSVAEFTRKLDPTRPISFVTDQSPGNDHAVQYMDSIGVNNYVSWYGSYAGHPETIPYQLASWLEDWYSAFKKPFYMSEYGAGAISGIHKDPPTMYTEDYQSEVMFYTWSVFDKYKEQFLMGELIWNFQDFESYEGSGRVDGNKKGILTRQRQPKAAARLVRQRYLSLAAGVGGGVCTDHDLLGLTQKRVYVQ